MSKGLFAAMIIELHLLQNFAPSSLNRDDAGSPKECEFGGHRRARISSQSFKRAVRTQLRDARLVDPAYLAERTKRASGEIARRVAAKGKPEAQAQQVASALLGSVKLNVTDGKTSYLLFLSERELQAAADICLRYWDQLSALTGSEAPQTPAAAAGGGARSRTASVPQDFKAAFERSLDGGRAVDLALFGRMIADLPDHNIEAACQVAHALSTHRVNMEFDFYTAVDDLRPEDTAGADMLGAVEFNSACFYRYANLDTRQLEATLGNEDHALTQQAIEAFLRAFVLAIPSGKQHSMAAHNPPSLVMAVVREAGQWNLANAFLKPVAPRADADLMQASIGALAAYWARLTAMYPTSLRGIWLATTDPEQLQTLSAHRVASVDEVIRQVVNVASAVDATPEGAEGGRGGRA